MCSYSAPRTRLKVAPTLMPDELLVLIERRNWLAARITAKQSVGWETQWDERERAALDWAIEILFEKGGRDG